MMGPLCLMVWVGIFFGSLGRAMAADAPLCHWRAASGAETFFAKMHVAVTSGLDITNSTEKSVGDLVMMGADIFVWRMMTRNGEVAIYHKTPSGLSYTQYRKALRTYQPISKSMHVSNAWIDRFARLLWTGQDTDFRAIHAAASGESACRSVWQLSKGTAPLPPFVMLAIEWNPTPVPQIVKVVVEEHMGVQYQLRIHDMAWSMPAHLAGRLSDGHWLKKHYFFTHLPKF